MRATIRALILTLGAVLSFMGCEEENNPVGNPPGNMPPPGTLTDQFAPNILDLLPTASVRVLNDPQISFRVEDPLLANGAQGSGVDPASVQVLVVDGEALPLERDGSTYRTSLVSLREGETTLEVTAQDRAGNQATATRSFSYDVTPPTVSFTTTPQGETTSNSLIITFGVAGKVHDEHLEGVSYSVNAPGADEHCGTADDRRFEEGVAAGRVLRSSFSGPALVDVQEPSVFDAQIVAINGATDGPRAMTYCGLFRATDLAQNGEGAHVPNILETAFAFRVNWSPPAALPDGAVSGVWSVVYSAGRTTDRISCGFGGRESSPVQVTMASSLGIDGQAVVFVYVPETWALPAAPIVTGVLELGSHRFTGQIKARPQGQHAPGNERWDIVFDGLLGNFIGQSRMEYDAPADGFPCFVDFTISGQKQ